MLSSSLPVFPVKLRGKHRLSNSAKNLLPKKKIISTGFTEIECGTDREKKAFVSKLKNYGWL